MKIYYHDAGLMTEMVAMPIYGNLLLNKWANLDQRQYVASVASGLKPIEVGSYDDPRLTMTCFMARSNFAT